MLRERGVGEEVEAALALFASFVMEPEQVRQIVRWDMAVLKESPWYKQILEEGLQQGLQQGVLEGRREDILHLLRVRFDPTGPALESIAEGLAAIEDAKLLQDLLVEAMQAESLDAFRERLPKIGPR